MIKKGTTLDTGNPTQLRIKKTDALRTSANHIFELLETYCTGSEAIAGLQRRLAGELRQFYSKETSYFPLIDSTSNFLEFRAEVLLKHIGDLRREIKSSESLKKDFDSLTPQFKAYLDTFGKIEHYSQKVNKLALEIDAQRIKKGKPSAKKLKQLSRNQKKLEDRKNGAFANASLIQESTNKLNLSRFDKMNPLIGCFIDSELILAQLPRDKTVPLAGFQQILAARADSRLNDVFFINTVTQGSGPSTIGDTHYYKHNVQNNYYIISDQKRNEEIERQERNQSSHSRVVGKGAKSEGMIEGGQRGRSNLAIDYPMHEQHQHQVVEYRAISEMPRSRF